MREKVKVRDTCHNASLRIRISEALRYGTRCPGITHFTYAASRYCIGGRLSVCESVRLSVCVSVCTESQKLLIRN